MLNQYNENALGRWILLYILWKEFGNQPDKLALHIRDIHEKSRGKYK